MKIAHIILYGLVSNMFSGTTEYSDWLQRLIWKVMQFSCVIIDCCEQSTWRSETKSWNWIPFLYSGGPTARWTVSLSKSSWPNVDLGYLSLPYLMAHTVWAMSYLMSLFLVFPKHMIAIKSKSQSSCRRWYWTATSIVICTGLFAKNSQKHKIFLQLYSGTALHLLSSPI